MKDNGGFVSESVSNCLEGAELLPDHLLDFKICPAR
jgi:hypothetical protein